MKKLNALDLVSLVLVIIGGLNWGLVGLVKIDLVASVLGIDTVLTRVINVLVGLAAVYLITVSMKLVKK